MKYYSDFKDINDNAIRVEIYTTDSAEPVSLLLAADAVNIEYTSDNIYKPLKQSCCTINVLTKDVLTDLYTGQLDNVKVKILRNGKLFWFGYLTPNVYSSEFSDDYDLLSLEFIDTIAQLENTKFTKSENTINSFLNVICGILDMIDADKAINQIYLHSSLAIDSSSDLLNKLFIQERNFYDEEGEAETNKEVMEDIISYLGMTLIQFEDKYLILDYQALQNNNYDFTVYDRTAGTATDVTLQSDIRNLKEIGVAEANASISLDDVFNKVSVIANTNQIDDTVADMTDELTNQNTDPDKYYETTIDGTVYVSAYFNSSIFTTTKPRTFGYDTPLYPEEITPDILDSLIWGCFFQKNDSYKTGEIKSTINWQDALTMVAPSSVQLFSSVSTLGYTKDYVIFKNGYFILNFDYMYNSSPFFTNTSMNTESRYENSKYSSGYENTKFPCRLMIGDYYWNGEEWLSYTKDYLPVKEMWEGCSWKISSEYGVKHYYYTWQGVETEVSEEEYNKMMLKDRFYLVHENKEGDTIFNSWKKLTNNVSYKQNLVDAEDGVLITLPTDKVLYGKMTLDIYSPMELGGYACYRTDKPKEHSYVRYCHLKDLAFTYTYNKKYKNIFSEEEYDPDILYSNVIDDANVNEMDDITLKVNTYSTNATSYSYVLKQTGEGYDYVDSLTNKHYGSDKKMEESIIQKYVDHYHKPRFIYTNTLNDKDIKPYTIIHEDAINKDLVVDSVSYNLANNTATVTTTEL